MKTFCMTCDKYMHAVRAYAYFFNKYWGDEQQVVVVGFSPPDFELPDNFTFFSLGKQEDYPVGKWSDGLIRLMDHFPKEEVFYLSLEDYWLCQPVRHDIVQMAVDYMRQFDYVIKFDLCADRRYAAGAEEYGTLGDVPLVKSDPDSPYHMSLYSGLWRRSLLKKILVSGESPWDVELRGTPRLAQYRDKMIVVGTVTDPWPIKHILAYRNGDPSRLLTEGFSADDIEAVRNMGYAD